VVLLIYFPVFACVETPIPLMGHIIGLLYTCILVAREVMMKAIVYIDCNGRNSDVPGIAAIIAVGTLPIYVCYLIILVWYIYHIFLDVVEIYKAATAVIHVQQANHKQESRYHLKYVTSLLKRPTAHRESLTVRLLSQVCYIFSPNKGRLRFPLKFLGVLTVMLIVLYQVSLHIY